jgi:diaminohydroxyphosphoribosylaminopyrimidine deaminase / 5-amino-6-(5-phosphoribosylamino)uracil reductase
MDHIVEVSTRSAPNDAYGALFAPLRAPIPDGCSFVLGRVAQSLDGYIATHEGESVWISGPDDLRHTHQLRALCDAVVVGARTIRADNPRLTTRLVEGPSPVRVVLDPDRRLDESYRVFRDGPETLLLCASDAEGADTVGAAIVLPVQRSPQGGEPGSPEGLDIGAILAVLRARGLRRIFVEGGGVTVSRFLAAGALDRLHVTVAPLVMGGGVPAFPLPPVGRLEEGRRFAWTAHRIGADILLDIPLARAG